MVTSIFIHLVCFLFSHSLIHSFGLFKASTSSSSHSLICLSIERFLLPPAVQLYTVECILYVLAPVLRNLKVSTVSSLCLSVCLSVSVSVCLSLSLSVGLSKGSEADCSK